MFKWRDSGRIIVPLKSTCLSPQKNKVLKTQLLVCYWKLFVDKWMLGTRYCLYSGSNVWKSHANDCREMLLIVTLCDENVIEFDWPSNDCAITQSIIRLLLLICISSQMTVHWFKWMCNGANDCLKMQCNVSEYVIIVNDFSFDAIECTVTQMIASSRYWLTVRENDSRFCVIEQQKV